MCWVMVSCHFSGTKRPDPSISQEDQKSPRAPLLPTAAGSALRQQVSSPAPSEGGFWPWLLRGPGADSLIAQHMAGENVSGVSLFPQGNCHSFSLRSNSFLHQKRRKEASVEKEIASEIQLRNFSRNLILLFRKVYGDLAFQLVLWLSHLPLLLSCPPQVWPGLCWSVVAAALTVRQWPGGIYFPLSVQTL